MTLQYRKNTFIAKKKSLDELWEIEKDNFFKDVKPSITLSSTKTNPLEQNFEQVIAFYVMHQRLPSDAKDASFEERGLARKLKSLRKHKDDPNLVTMDTHGLLQEPSQPEQEDAVIVPDLDDEDALLAFINSSLGDDITQSVMDTSRLSAKPKTTRSDAASRKPCPDFYKYMKLFSVVRNLVDNQKATIVPFKAEHAQINIGDVFFWDGLTCIVTEEVKMEFDSKGEPNPRLRVIFDNGMYADLLKQSISQGMYRSKNTRKVTPGVYNMLNSLSQPLEAKYGKKTGEIYFVASLSDSPNVKQYKNLIKIGVTTRTTPKRVKDADTQSTYLYAPVRVMKIMPCYNMNVTGLEDMIHAALNDYRKIIAIKNHKTGKVTDAIEWFDIPLQQAYLVAMDIAQSRIPNMKQDEHGNLYNHDH